MKAQSTTVRKPEPSEQARETKPTNEPLAHAIDEIRRDAAIEPAQYLKDTVAPAGGE